MLAQFVSMLGYNTLFDAILSMAVQELDFDQSIFSSIHFNELTNFIFLRSLQIKSLQIVIDFDDAKPYSEPNILRLLEFHSRKVVCVCSIATDRITPVEVPKYSDYLKFVNSLKWTRVPFTALYRSGVLSRMHLLTELVINLRNQSDITMLNDIIEAPWFKMSTKLILKFDSNEGDDAAEYFFQLNGILQRNKELDITLDIYMDGSLSPFEIDMFAKLIHQTHSIRAVTVESEPECIQSIVAMLNVDTVLKRLSLWTIPYLSAKEVTSAVFSTYCISTLELNFIPSSSKFIFQNLSSLKHLCLFNCQLNLHAIENISDTLEELVFDCVEITEPGVSHGIQVPVHLRTLSLYGNPDFYTLPVILNIDQLHSLREVSVTIDPASVSLNSIYLNKLDGVTEEFLKITNAFTLTQLQVFISKLPSTLSALTIINKAYLRVDMDNYDFCCPDELTFEHFEKLNTLKFDCLNQSGFFNLSIFPKSLETLDFTTSNAQILSGSFPLALRTLNIYLSSYDGTLSTFFKSITNLTNLATLRIEIPDYLSVDFRDISFPVQLCSFNLKFDYPNVNSSNPTQVGATYIVLDCIPSSLNYFGLGLVEHTIVIDGSKGESIDSIRKKLSVIGTSDSTWIQYTRFQEETSILDSISTLFVI
ncbi:unnamed protein product [Ambrosiozyma monospora]|uniref:Unnamed protein product n=1 Tax=Ambrosiozyma monospora TaxID=43982 RepID=A0A9W7DK24_AMBMO|nr:unnamed protein product [Ambrosiozyma monospora]